MNISQRIFHMHSYQEISAGSTNFRCRGCATARVKKIQRIHEYKQRIHWPWTCIGHHAPSPHPTRTLLRFFLHLQPRKAPIIYPLSTDKLAKTYIVVEYKRVGCAHVAHPSPTPCLLRRSSLYFHISSSSVSNSTEFLFFLFSLSFVPSNPESLSEKSKRKIQNDGVRTASLCATQSRPLQWGSDLLRYSNCCFSASFLFLGSNSHSRPRPSRTSRTRGRRRSMPSRKNPRARDPLTTALLTWLIGLWSGNSLRMSKIKVLISELEFLALHFLFSL